MAYWCFTYIAALSLAVALLSVLPLEFATFQVIGMLSIPVVLLGVVAGVVGAFLTLVRHRRDWPLVAMSVAFVGIALLFALGESLPAAQYRHYKTLLDGATWLSLLVIVLLSGRWLFFARKRDRQAR